MDLFIPRERVSINCAVVTAIPVFFSSSFDRELSATPLSEQYSHHKKILGADGKQPTKKKKMSYDSQKPYRIVTTQQVSTSYFSLSHGVSLDSG